MSCSPELSDTDTNICVGKFILGAQIVSLALFTVTGVHWVK